MPTRTGGHSHDKLQPSRPQLRRCSGWRSRGEAGDESGGGRLARAVGLGRVPSCCRQENEPAAGARDLLDEEPGTLRASSRAAAAWPA